jgi:hypothetical protein
MINIVSQTQNHKNMLIRFYIIFSKFSYQHIPKEHTRNHFKNIADITLADMTTDFELPAKIITSERSIKNKKFDEKYIGETWFKYLKRHKVRSGDLLLFEVEENYFVYVTHKKKEKKKNG